MNVLKQKEEVCGQSEINIDFLALECPVHKALVAPLNALKQEAVEAGFKLTLASGFRGFDRQLAIWNSKALGQRPVFDKNGVPVDMSALSKKQKVFAILRWSALPGTSRHHWGSDIDVYDSSSIDEGYQLQLSEAEYSGGGPFYVFNNWLTDFLALPGAAFFRPYAKDVGGVAPEPWHISYAPIANQYREKLTVSSVRESIAASDIELKETILSELENIYAQFVV